MDDITLNLLALAGFALIGGLIFFLVRRKQSANEQAIMQLAAEKGWKVETIREPLLWGQRLISPHWTLESVSRASGKESGPGSSDISMLTVWRADAPGSTLLIGERQSGADLGTFGEMLQKQILQQVLGVDADGLSETPVGSEALRQKYMVWAKSGAEIRISPVLESILFEWKGVKPVIKRTSEGLIIELSGAHLKTAPDLLRLINLCETLLKTL
jgi:LPXTG-motif cell wall-anchored protein